MGMLYSGNGFVFNGKTVLCRPAIDDGRGPPIRASQVVHDETVPTPITCNIIRVRGLPDDKKKRDVFKLFFNFSTTRIRDGGGDDVFIEFTSKSEAEKAYRAKKSAALNDVRVRLEGATNADFEAAQAAAQAQANKKELPPNWPAWAASIAPAAKAAGK